MKQIFFVLLCTLSCTLSFAQTRIEVVYKDAETTVLDVSVKDYTLQPIGLQPLVQTEATPTDLNGAFSVHLEGGTPLLAKGRPALDKISATIQIPATGAMQFEILDADYTYHIDQILVAPSKGNLKRTVNPAEVAFVFGEVYDQDVSYPGELVQMQKPFVYRNTRGMHLWLQPLQYNPKTQTLRFYHHFRVKLTRVNAPSENELTRATKPGGMRETEAEICRRLYINHPENSNPTLEKAPIGQNPERLLVLCPDALIADIQPLVDWKRQMGLHTTVVPISVLGSNDTTTVMQYVRQAYQTDGLDYLLLVGDASQFPPPMRLDGSYYSCDNCFGYLDGDDNMPEVMVGRLHAETPEQLRLMVQRNLEYEKSPVVDTLVAPWLDTQIWAASDEGEGIGDEGQADWQHANEWKTKYLADGCGDFFEIYDANHSAESPTLGHFTADKPQNAQQSEILALLNGRGVGVFNYTGHGWQEGLVSGDYRRFYGFKHRLPRRGHAARM
jgi:gingipain R